MSERERARKGQGKLTSAGRMGWRCCRGVAVTLAAATAAAISFAPAGAAGASRGTRSGGVETSDEEVLLRDWVTHHQVVPTKARGCGEQSGAIQTERSMHSLVARVGNEIERLARRHAAIHTIQRRLHVLSPIQVRRALVSEAKARQRAGTATATPAKPHSLCFTMRVARAIVGEAQGILDRARTVSLVDTRRIALGIVAEVDGKLAADAIRPIVDCRSARSV